MLPELLYEKSGLVCDPKKPCKIAYQSFFCCVRLDLLLSLILICLTLLQACSPNLTLNLFDEILQVTNPITFVFGSEYVSCHMSDFSSNASGVEN